MSLYFSVFRVDITNKIRYDKNRKRYTKRGILHEHKS